MGDRYRIEERDGGFEPQMRHTCGAVDGERWFPLAPNGYWLEPGAFAYGRITKRSILPTREEAERAIMRAAAINGEHIREIGAP